MKAEGGRGGRGGCSGVLEGGSGVGGGPGVSKGSKASQVRKSEKRGSQSEAGGPPTLSSWADGFFMISMGGGRGVWASSSCSSSPPLCIPDGVLESNVPSLLWTLWDAHTHRDTHSKVIKVNTFRKLLLSLCVKVSKLLTLYPFPPVMFSVGRQKYEWWWLHPLPSHLDQWQWGIYSKYNHYDYYEEE